VIIVVLVNEEGIVVVVIEGVGISLVVGIGIIFVGLEQMINLSSSMKSFGLSGDIGIVLFSWVSVKSSKQYDVVL
jgi:hypothetical protein